MTIAMVIVGIAISIHAPRVGRDRRVFIPHSTIEISIHAPRVGRDQMAFEYTAHYSIFQSTRPVWGATFW